MVEYIQAVIDFTRKSKPHRKAVHTLKELKDEMEIIESKELERNLMKSEEVDDEVGNDLMYQIRENFSFMHLEAEDSTLIDISYMD